MAEKVNRGNLYDLEVLDAAQAMCIACVAECEELSSKAAQLAKIIGDDDNWGGGTADPFKEGIAVNAASLEIVKGKFVAMEKITSKIREIMGNSMATSNRSFSEAKDALLVAKAKVNNTGKK